MRSMTFVSANHARSTEMNVANLSPGAIPHQPMCFQKHSCGLVWLETRPMKA